MPILLPPKTGMTLLGHEYTTHEALQNLLMIFEQRVSGSQQATLQATGSHILFPPLDEAEIAQNILSNECKLKSYVPVIEPI